MDDVIIVGGGLGGLAAARALVEAGRSVTVVERSSFPGGMAQGFVRGGRRWPLVDHRAFEDDLPLMRHLSARGLDADLTWEAGPPAPLPGADPGLAALASAARRPSGSGPASAWISGLGAEARAAAEGLCQARLGASAHQVSAAWLRWWVGRGGPGIRSGRGTRRPWAPALVDALVAEIEARGGAFRLGVQVSAVQVGAGAIRGVRLDSGEELGARAVIAALPRAAAARLIPGSAEAGRGAAGAVAAAVVAVSGLGPLPARCMRALSPRLSFDEVSALADPQADAPLPLAFQVSTAGSVASSLVGTPPRELVYRFVEELGQALGGTPEIAWWHLARLPGGMPHAAGPLPAGSDQPPGLFLARPQGMDPAGRTVGATLEAGEAAAGAALGWLASLSGEAA